MVTDQNHSSDISSEQEVIRRTEKIARLLEAYKQNAEAYSALSSIREALKKQFEDCHPQYNTLEKRVKRLEKDIRSLKIELGDLDECVDRETVVDLIHKIVPILINEKSKGSAYSSKSSEDSDSVEIIERSHGEANLEWTKRKEFLFGRIVQGNYTVKEYYSKLKECNSSNDYPEWLLKNLFLRGLSPENAFKVLLDGLEVLTFDEIVERLSPEQ
ncbi:hypothetical protein GLOIN_2v1778881 [Rhizophagus irregularis DAOM 181602=DAOM 197198]|nr:hypothetical protein GLOIN_2v1778881 [Rhizophagus irregularis DAOM 181602=DAOM 197198]